jgi:hypothetical protein
VPHIVLRTGDAPAYLQMPAARLWTSPTASWLAAEAPDPLAAPGPLVTPREVALAQPRLVRTVRRIMLTRGGRCEYLLTPSTARRLYRVEWLFRHRAVRWWTFDVHRRIAYLWVADRVAPLSVLVRI